MAEASMPAAAELQGEVPATPSKPQGGTPGAPAPADAAATYSTILGTSLALDQIHKVRRFASDARLLKVMGSQHMVKGQFSFMLFTMHLKDALQAPGVRASSPYDNSTMPSQPCEAFL
jgi:hypothetical protein